MALDRRPRLAALSPSHLGARLAPGRFRHARRRIGGRRRFVALPTGAIGPDRGRPHRRRESAARRGRWSSRPTRWSMTTRPMRCRRWATPRSIIKGKILEADRVTYFKDTGRVLAEGSVKLTEPDGSVTHADRMELSGDFKQGFVDTLRADTKERTHLGATRSDKVDQDTTVFRIGNLHGLPELRPTSGTPAVVAAARQEDHSQEQRADALFRRRDLRSLRRIRSPISRSFRRPTPASSANPAF